MRSFLAIFIVDNRVSFVDNLALKYFLDNIFKCYNANHIIVLVDDNRQMIIALRVFLFCVDMQIWLQQRV